VNLRLICLPYAGVGASVFHSWHAAVPENMQVCAVELPGRETRYQEAPLSDITQIVRELAEALGCFLDVPYTLFGHSLGALVAFELARELRRRNQPAPVRFFASACRAPQMVSLYPSNNFLDEKMLWDQQLGRGQGEGGLLIDYARTPWRADVKLFTTYRYVIEPPLRSPITAIAGHDDRLLDHREMVAWHSQTTGSFNLRLVRGDHFFIRSTPEEVIRVVLGEFALSTRK
jgi:surfactin synthase thioesterase subunit